MEYSCPHDGCGKVCKSQGGFTLHLRACKYAGRRVWLPQAAPENPDLINALRFSNNNGGQNRKRPLEQNPQDAPKTKRTKSQAPTAVPTTMEELPDWAYDVAGIWEIDASELSHDIFGFEREYPGAPPPFTMEIKYSANQNAERHLWATFSWGKMSGAIRMCPGHKYRTSHLQFYDLCRLKRGVWPGPSPHGKSIWNLRWRAKHGEKRLFKNSGSATDEYETQLEFSRDANGTMSLTGKMVIGGYKARKFKGLKTGQQPQSNGRSLGFWWSSLKHPAEESRHEICRGCKGAIDDSSEEESEPESKIDWDAIYKKRAAERAREEEQERQPWPTEMTGEWKINFARDCDRDKDQKNISSYMNIYYEDGQAAAGRRQYYANFQISPNWHGTMKLCPVGQLDTKKDETIEEFEKACILKDGMKAGPPPDGIHEFFVKWRGFLTEPDMPKRFNQPGPRDNMTTRITFKLGEDGKLVSRFILLQGSNGGTVKFFDGVRIGDGKPRDPNDPTIEELWEKKKFKAPPPPPPPKLWPWKSPLPALKIEAPPVWAWDVLGKWEITAPEVAEALKIDKGAPMSMTIRMANDPRPSKTIGRQLWATFDFGPKLSGCMRFCPLPENSRPADTVADFEKQCVLKNGVWPGNSASKPGQSFQKWGFRWRAQRDSGKTVSCSDTVEHMFNFKRDEDGTLRLSGVFGAVWMICLWSAVKVQDGDLHMALAGGVGDANAIWNSLNRRSEPSDDDDSDGRDGSDDSDDSYDSDDSDESDDSDDSDVLIKT